MLTTSLEKARLSSSAGIAIERKKGYHVSESKAKAIYALACNGIPTLTYCAASTKMLTQEAVSVLKEVNKTLEVILLIQMQELITTLPEYDVVRAMKVTYMYWQRRFTCPARNTALER